VTDVRLKTIALGYMRAYKRLQETYSQAYLRLPSTNLDTQAAEDVWVALFEALSWLDVLRLRPEAAARMVPDLRNGLRFVRGRVHHEFEDAIEFRADVLLPLGPAAAVTRMSGPLLIAVGAGAMPPISVEGSAPLTPEHKPGRVRLPTRTFWPVGKLARLSTK
jgi:hypothetical protein